MELDRMKRIYEITGVRKVGDRVNLQLKEHKAVEQKETTQDILQNALGYVEKMKIDAIKTNIPEMIAIPYEEWKTYKWNIGDLVEVDVKPYD